MDSVIGFRPYYVFRPFQILKRVKLQFRPRPPASVDLPWGHRISLGADTISQEIARTGVFDILVTETLRRLAGSGEFAVDVGGNFGYMISVLAAAVGHTGRVLVAEPHPALFAELCKNIANWDAHGGARITPLNLALSDHAGLAKLHIGSQFAQNRGTGSLEANAELAASNAIAVTVQVLDELICEPVGVMKIDVEGHELSVLRGASHLLSRRAIRDIIFEEHLPYPTAVTSMLESADYKVFRLSGTNWGPELRPPDESTSLPGAPNYLATCDPVRACDRFRSRGWRSLRKR